MSGQLETAVSEAANVFLQTDSASDQRPDSIGEILRQHEAEEALRGLQEDLALLQAEQERGLHSLGGALEQLGEELGAVRAQLAAMAEPLLATRISTDAPEQRADPD